MVSSLTLLKLGAPSVCGASLTNLSMPSKWSVIGMHFWMFVILAAGCVGLVTSCQCERGDQAGLLMEGKYERST